MGATKVAVFTVVNALGAIVDRQGRTLRGLRDPKTGARLSQADAMRRLIERAESQTAPPTTAPTGTRQLFTINPLTAEATFVSTLALPLPPGGIPFAIDFDPVEDRLRVITVGRDSVRVNVDTGAVVRDQGLFFAVDPGIAGVAYTNNFAGATSTTLYGIGTSADSLYRIDPATGTVTPVGGLGVDALNTGFDISGETGIAYASLAMETPTARFSSLYRINLATGQATLVGQIATGFGFSISGLTVVPSGGGSAIPEPATIVLLGTGLLAVGAAARHSR